MLNNKVTIRAKDVETATLEGLKRLNITKEHAEIHVIYEGKRGFLGFGQQDAVVEVSLKTDLSIEEMYDAAVEEIPREHEKTLVHLDEVNTTGRLQEEDTYEVETDDPDHVVASAIDPKKEFMEEVSEQDSEEKLAVAEENEEKEKVEDLSSREEAIQEVGQYIKKILSEYGADVMVTSQGNQRQVSFEIETSKPGLVIGKHGRTINSLQILAQILLHRLLRKNLTVILNVGDYRNRRAQILQQIAEQEAENVLSTRESSILDPLPAYERKQIHNHLSKIENIRTRSEGKEPNRYLVIEYRP